MSLDFTSAAYLGWSHGAADLPGWTAIAEGRPAALHEPAVVAELGGAVATLQGEEDGVAGSSSLALAMDALGPALVGNWQVYVDAGCYPVLRWAARQRGEPIVVAHYRPVALAAMLERTRSTRPLLAIDGYCVGCGRSAPLAAYARLLADRDGRLFVDDTQAFGIIGPAGAGTTTATVPRHTVLRLVSLGKAFNAPIAVLSGSRATIQDFRNTSFTRVYCGPPSLPAALAGTRAIALNPVQGSLQRARLRTRLRDFRAACRDRGVPLRPGLFPVQTIETPALSVTALVAALAARGLQAFAGRQPLERTPRLRMIITAAHAEADVHSAADLLASVMPEAIPKAADPKEDSHVTV